MLWKKYICFFLNSWTNKSRELIRVKDCSEVWAYFTVGGWHIVTWLVQSTACRYYQPSDMCLCFLWCFWYLHECKTLMLTVPARGLQRYTGSKYKSHCLEVDPHLQTLHSHWNLAETMILAGRTFSSVKSCPSQSQKSIVAHLLKAKILSSVFSSQNTVSRSANGENVLKDQAWKLVLHCVKGADQTFFDTSRLLAVLFTSSSLKQTGKEGFYINKRNYTHLCLT